MIHKHYDDAAHARIKTPRGGRPGAAMVEFAFVAPVLFLVIMGIFECGRVVYVSQLLASAARLGARTAIVPGKSIGDVNTATTAYLQAVALNSGDASVTVNGVAVNGTDTLAAATPGTDITVRVTMPADRVSWVPGLKYTGSANLSGQFSMRRH